VGVTDTSESITTTTFGAESTSAAVSTTATESITTASVGESTAVVGVTDTSESITTTTFGAESTAAAVSTTATESITTAFVGESTAVVGVTDTSESITTTAFGAESTAVAESTTTSEPITSRSTSSTFTTTTTVAYDHSAITTITTTATSTITSTTTTQDPSTCRNGTHILDNGNCVTIDQAIITAVNTLRNNPTNSTVVAKTLSQYISLISNSNSTLNQTYKLTANEIDTYLANITNINLIINTTDSILVAQQLNQRGNVMVLGASFTRGIGGQVINTANTDNITNSFSSAAAIISNQSITGVMSLNMLIIDKPTTYKDLDKSSDRFLASSVIVVALHRNDSASTPMNISLYFQVLQEYHPNRVAQYYCSFYDTTSLKWNESGCTMPENNTAFNRYECSCNHLSTFALVWSPYVTPCDTSTHVSMSNGSCLSKPNAQLETVNTLRGNTTNSTVIADALSSYISAITDSNTTLNSSYTLSVNEIDTILSNINNTNITINTNDSILVVQQPNQGDNVIVLGASFTRGTGGEVVNNTNKERVTNSYLSTAAIINQESLDGVTSLNILIIDKPTTYENIDNSTNKTVASSVI
ncbi:unnamed protein product, partial [Rotaria sp. Silwood2]